MSRRLNEIEQGQLSRSLARILFAELREINMATPKLQGLASAIHKLHFGLEDRAEKLSNRIAEADVKADKVFTGAHTALDGIEGHVTDVERYLAEIEGANGAPIIKP